jgi:Icc-related predicted phosphoesterase
MERVGAAIQATLHASDEQLLRRAIQVAAVIGNKDTLFEISSLTTHSNSLVAADARASQFYLRQRLRSLKV